MSIANKDDRMNREIRSEMKKRENSAGDETKERQRMTPVDRHVRSRVPRLQLNTVVTVAR